MGSEPVKAVLVGALVPALTGSSQCSITKRRAKELLAVRYISSGRSLRFAHCRESKRQARRHRAPQRQFRRRLSYRACIATR